MSAHGLAPSSRRRRLRRLLPPAAGILLLLVVFAAFVLVPPADGAVEGNATGDVVLGSPAVAEGTHHCPEGSLD